ncbi:hypothetical protein ABTZ58_38610 [Streptomyces sp. NPDC094143]|uniref:hypothetical protein n=1 Tax=Streptomyces sp. NPDC094143 TaxID=3155310 RepID=UPI00331D0218
MPDLYDLLATRASEGSDSAASTPPPSNPGTVYTASVETIDNDSAGIFLNTANI